MNRERDVALYEKTPVDDGKCFACGPKSEQGLRLVFQPDDDGGVTAVTVLAAYLQGWSGVAHGGIVSMLLDEAMAHAAALAGFRGVTAGIRVRFRRPTPLDAELTVRGSLQWQRRSVLGLHATLTDVRKTTLAVAEGEFVVRGELDAAAFFTGRAQSL